MWIHVSTHLNSFRGLRVDLGQLLDCTINTKPIKFSKVSIIILFLYQTDPGCKLLRSVVQILRSDFPFPSLGPIIKLRHSSYFVVPFCMEGLLLASHEGNSPLVSQLYLQSILDFSLG